MATFSSVKRRASSLKVTLFFSLFLIMWSVLAGRLVWFRTRDFKISLIVFGVSAAVLGTGWFLLQWQSRVTWLCRLQMILHKAGALPSDYRFIDDAMPWNVNKKTQDVVNIAEQVVQENIKSLAANRHALDKYLGSQASRHAIQGAGTGFGGQMQSVFILFSDIRGFTQMTELLTSQETMRVLNQIFSALAMAVEHQGGEINKFIGDAILVYFHRSPENERKEAEKVVRAALEMQEKFRVVTTNNNDLKARNVSIGLGIGIVAGQAIMGNLGSRNRMEFTLIGNSVNLASRLCSIAPQDEILVDEELAMLVNDKFHIESRLPVQLKGKKEKTTPYCILGDLTNRDDIRMASEYQI